MQGGSQHGACCFLSAICFEDQELSDATKSAPFRNDVLAEYVTGVYVVLCAKGLPHTYNCTYLLAIFSVRVLFKNLKFKTKDYLFIPCYFIKLY